MTAKFCQGAFLLWAWRSLLLSIKIELKVKLDLSNKQTIAFLVLLNLVLVLPLLIMAAQEKQELRKKATEASVFQVKLGTETGTETERTIKAGEKIKLQVFLTNAGQENKSVLAAGVTISFDRQFFEVDQLACSQDFPAPARPENNPPPSPPGFGVEDNQVFLSCFRFQNEAPMNPLIISPGKTVTLASFTVRAKTDAPSGSTKIAFTRTNVPDVASLTNLALSGQAVTFNVAGTTSSLASLSLKIKFAGVDQKRADQKIKVQVAHQGQILQTLPDLEMTADENGIYQNQLIDLSAAVTPDASYDLLVKGPKHLQTKFSNLNIKTGENTFNLSQKSLLAGDLPHPVYGQDGTVGALDAVLLVNCFQTPQNQNCLDQADLNLDGIINSLDMNLINLTILGERWNDEGL